MGGYYLSTTVVGFDYSYAALIYPPALLYAVLGPQNKQYSSLAHKHTSENATVQQIYTVFRKKS